MAQQATTQEKPARMHRASVLAEVSKVLDHHRIKEKSMQRAIRQYAREGVVHPGRAEASRCAWISPNGDVFPVPYAGHSAMARLILGREGFSSSELEEAGWIHLSDEADFYLRGEPSRRAVDALFDVCAEHGRVEAFNRFIKNHCK